MRNLSKDILFGIAVGDALGVPYEFSSRVELQKNPTTDMDGFKVHDQPPGTWSDDSSLTFCLAESLIENYSLLSTAEKFIKWKNHGYWTARGEVFDIGITTAKSITILEEIIVNKSFEDFELLTHNAEEYDNGNGSLMRILPLIFEITDKSIIDQFDIVWKNSALTHRHIRSAMCCLIYLRFADYLAKEFDKMDAYNQTCLDIKKLWSEMNFSAFERKHFTRVIENDISTYEKSDILSGGYVIESLEASLWCFLNTETYETAVLEAINLGHDTDTTGAITGGLAGIYYTYEKIPKKWITIIARMEEIENLSERLNEKYNL